MRAAPQPACSAVRVIARKKSRRADIAAVLVVSRKIAEDGEFRVKPVPDGFLVQEKPRSAQAGAAPACYAQNSSRNAVTKRGMAGSKSAGERTMRMPANSGRLSPAICAMMRARRSSALCGASTRLSSAR